MVDTDRLIGEIRARKLTQKKVYEAIGLTKRQWTTRIANKRFDSDDIYKICLVVGNDIMPVFFVDEKSLET